MNFFKKLFYRKHELIGTVEQLDERGSRGVYVVKNHKEEVLRAYVKGVGGGIIMEYPIDAEAVTKYKKIIRI